MAPDIDLAGARLGTHGLTVGYNGVPLISDIAMSAARGEIITLIGPNGSGKTTILKTIARQLAPVAGTILIEGNDIKKLSGREIAREMAVVLTERIRPDLMTCYEFVSAGRYPYTGSFGLLTDTDREAVDAALLLVNASQIADKYVSQISDGQYQRLLIARAVCQDPEIIVLDEPTSFLDIKHKKELLEILSDMSKTRGVSVIMSLHEIDLAERISDRIVCVKGDRIAAYGTPDEIFTGSTISDLYDIDAASYDALLGKLELSAPKGRIRCFVIGGNGTGIPFYRELQKKGTAFAAGILMPNDIDVSVASSLAGKLICTEPFAPADESQREEAEKIIDSSDFVIACGCPEGEYNRVNGELERYAQSAGKTIVRSLEELREVLA
jgi:iron complex transport system ATP-binding protein